MKAPVLYSQQQPIVKSIILAVFSAVLLAIPFSFGKLWILAWFCFIPLFFALKYQSGKKAFLISYLAGVIFWTATLYWLIHVTLLGQIILIFYLACYFGVFGFLISRPSIKLRILFIPTLWVMLEYLRSHLFSGFPWALLGYSQYLNLTLIQIADIAGVWLVSFLVVLINVAIQEMILGKRKLYSSLIIVLLVAVFTYGYLRLNQGLSGIPLKISVIQGNIPQERKWEESSREFIMERYFKLTVEARKDNPDLIIWPEASFPVIPEEEPVYYGKLSRFIKTIGKPLVFGAVTCRLDSYYNSALMASGEGILLGRYDKLHLVPFGEYIPFRNILKFLDTIAPIGDITRGKYYTLFKIRSQKIAAPVLNSGRQVYLSGRYFQFGALICFEDVFPDLARNFVNKGADFLINITNDAWFGKTTEASQHLAGSVFRAVENRVYLVRSANTGISGFINPQGRIISSVHDEFGNLIFVPGFKTQNIFIRGQASFYSNHGDFLIVICLLCLLYLFIFALHKNLAKKVLLVFLLILTIYSAFVFYFADKYYFISPINYSGDLIIRSDARGDGFFGTNRSGRRMHEGIDLFAKIGTPVLAVRSGIVIQANRNRGMGKYIIIRHSPSLVTIYGHLSQILVTKNKIVRQGDVIGAVGKTGNANYKDMQSHLHFEIEKNNIPQDPLEYLQ